MTDSLKNFLDHLTTAPGVYRMLDAEGTVLYVGKAFNLKKRVNSYFRSTEQTPKTKALVKQIVSIDVSVTRTEAEALILESSLIKSLRPKYNILMRDDKTYPFIQLSEDQAFPRLSLVRYKKRPQKGTFFGPYPNSYAARQALHLIHKIFQLRDCNDTYFQARSRPCLQYQIKRCSAPCVKYISVGDYQQAVKNAKRFLQGKSQQIIDDLENRLHQAVERLAFEEAALLRDQMKQLRIVSEQQGVIQQRGDFDVIVIEARPGFACIQWVSVRQGEVLASQAFFPEVPQHTLDDASALEEAIWQDVFMAFVTYYYVDMPERIPTVILTDRSIRDKDIFEQILSEQLGKKCRIQVPRLGPKVSWLDFAHNNLKKSVAQHLTSKTLISKRYQALASFLKLPGKIQRMECFDISHTQGQGTVASCVVFDETGPCKREYRQFNIEGVTPGDDCAAIEQAVTRRFKRLKEKNWLPTLLLIDGGMGQFNAAQRALEKLAITDVYILSIAKGSSRKAGWERLLLMNATQEVTLPSESPALHLLQHIRDESHRFAINAHRKRRQKGSFESSLLAIPGIGAKRRQALLNRFGGIRELARAPISEIEKVRGISHELAVRLHDHFQVYNAK